MSLQARELQLQKDQKAIEVAQNQELDRLQAEKAAMKREHDKAVAALKEEQEESERAQMETDRKQKEKISQLQGIIDESVRIVWMLLAADCIILTHKQSVADANYSKRVFWLCLSRKHDHAHLHAGTQGDGLCLSQMLESDKSLHRCPCNHMVTGLPGRTGWLYRRLRASAAKEEGNNW